MKQHILRKTSTLAVGLFMLASSAWANDPVASASASGTMIDWSPTITSQILLEVVNGFEFTHREVFTDSAPYFSSTEGGRSLNDGQYTYQLTGSTAADGSGQTVRQSGSFEVAGGNITLDESSAEE